MELRKTTTHSLPPPQEAQKVPVVLLLVLIMEKEKIFGIKMETQILLFLLVWTGVVVENLFLLILVMP